MAIFGRFTQRAQRAVAAAQQAAVLLHQPMWGRSIFFWAC